VKHDKVLSPTVNEIREYFLTTVGGGGGGDEEVAGLDRIYILSHLAVSQIFCVNMSVTVHFLLPQHKTEEKI
jgi:hypothetical protein